ncbi:hypothetical protein BDR04DRAFT_1108049 [Suillus decipiens]|nr:hypothetical protein BDR04DRAFT_1108049 [Suillus decipiens]
MISVQVMFTAPPLPHKNDQGSSTIPPALGTTAAPLPRHTHSLPDCWIIWYFFCCASAQHADANAQPTWHQQGQPRG